VYHNGAWRKSTNIKQTKAMTAIVRHLLRSLLRHPARSIEAPNIPETSCKPHAVLKGAITTLDPMDTLPTFQVGPADATTSDAPPGPGTTPRPDISATPDAPMTLNPQELTGLSSRSSISLIQAEIISLSYKCAAASLPKPV
jgi:hypothetical protein